MARNFISIALRVCQMICLIVALGTLLAGARHCARAGYMPRFCTDYRSIDISRWPLYDFRSRMAGQYFVMSVCILFFLVSLALIIREIVVKSDKKLLVIGICIFSGLVTLVAAIVEILYSAGEILKWDSYNTLGFRTVFSEMTISWIATCVFLLLAMIFYFADAVVELASKRASYSPKQQPKPA